MLTQVPGLYAPNELHTAGGLHQLLAGSSFGRSEDPDPFFREEVLHHVDHGREIRVVG